MKIVIIAAIAQNGVIGRDGKIPWKIPSDMASFVYTTQGHPVIMGRKTYESIPPKFRPLDKGRTNIVVTRHPEEITFSKEGIHLAGSLKEAIEIASQFDKMAFVAGGSEIYREALPLADTLALTVVCAEVEGDAKFPEIDEERYPVKIYHSAIQGEKDQYPTELKTLFR